MDEKRRQKAVAKFLDWLRTMPEATADVEISRHEMITVGQFRTAMLNFDYARMPALQPYGEQAWLGILTLSGSEKPMAEC